MCKHLVVDVNTDAEKKLFRTGSNLEPLVAKMADNRITLSRDDMIIFLNAKGEPTHQTVLNFSEPPLDVVCQFVDV